MRLGYCLAALILLFPMVTDSSVRLKFSADTDGNSCEIVRPGLYQPISVYVLVDAWVDHA